MKIESNIYCRSSWALGKSGRRYYKLSTCILLSCPSASRGELQALGKENKWAPLLILGALVVPQSRRQHGDTLPVIAFGTGGKATWLPLQ